MFAVRLDTFEKDDASVFILGSNEPDDLTEVRRHLLTAFERLPIAGEYLHRDAFDIGDRYGKDTFLLIDRFGTDKVPAAPALKSRLDGWCELVRHAGAGGPRAAVADGDAAGSSAGPGCAPTATVTSIICCWRCRRAMRRRRARSCSASSVSARAIAFRNADEGRKAFLLLAVAGAAVRYRAVHAAQVQDIVALDVALRRDRDWWEALPNVAATMGGAALLRALLLTCSTRITS